MIWDNIFISAKNIRILDNNAINNGIDEQLLMENAARAVYSCSVSPDINKEKIVVLCGIGKNGGDGYGVACMLKKDGYQVDAISLGEPKSTSSKYYKDSFTSLGGRIISCCSSKDEISSLITESTLIIDAMFGFSFKGEFTAEAAFIAELTNVSDSFIISVDLPSGVSADGNIALGSINADITCTFTINKTATCSYPGLGFCGRVELYDIGIPEWAMEGVPLEGYILNKNIVNYIPKRFKNSNKYDYGVLLSLCGSPNMPGAAYLSSIGALRSGVGLLKLTSDRETLSILKNRLSEPVFVPFIKEDIIEQKYTAMLVGCGIGRSYDNVLSELLTYQKQTTIIDADGINYIAAHINVLTEMQGEIILTPHAGEMARLIGKSVEYVNKNRIECAKAFAMEFGCVLVLKGGSTVIASQDGDIFISPTGNSGLSTGGSGDVLAGVIASLAAQGMSGARAACLGVYFHGLAADNLTGRYGVRGLLPHDLPEEIGRLLG